MSIQTKEIHIEQNMQNSRFTIQTKEEALALSTYLAKNFNDPARIQSGLYQMLLNAVEHGVLDIGHDVKSELLEKGIWEKEIQRRQSLPLNRNKTIDVVFGRRTDGLFVVITDPGNGFDWKPWLSLDPARANAPNGRGIAQAQQHSFDRISYNDKGNKVILQSRNTQPLKW